MEVPGRNPGCGKRQNTWTSYTVRNVQTFSAHQYPRIPHNRDESLRKTLCVSEESKWGNPLFYHLTSVSLQEAKSGKCVLRQIYLKERLKNSLIWSQGDREVIEHLDQFLAAYIKISVENRIATVYIHHDGLKLHTITPDMIEIWITVGTMWRACRCITKSSKKYTDGKNVNLNNEQYPTVQR